MVRLPAQDRHGAGLTMPRQTAVRCLEACFEHGQQDALLDRNVEHYFGAAQFDPHGLAARKTRGTRIVLILIQVSLSIESHIHKRHHRKLNIPAHSAARCGEEYLEFQANPINTIIRSLQSFCLVKYAHSN